MGEVNSITGSPVKSPTRPRPGRVIKRGPCGLLNPARKGKATREDGATIYSVPLRK